MGSMDAKPTASDTSWAATRTDSQLKLAYVPPSGKEGKRELQQNNAVAAELRKRGIPLPGRRVDDTKGLRNQVKRHQAAAARGNGQSLAEGLPAGHGASLQASKDAQARIAARAAHRRSNPGLTPPPGADSELLDALEPGMDHSAVHRSTSGSWAVDNGDGTWSLFNKQGQLHTDSGSKRQLPADAWPTVHGKSSNGQSMDTRDKQTLDRLRAKKANNQKLTMVERANLSALEGKERRSAGR